MTGEQVPGRIPPGIPGNKGSLVRYWVAVCISIARLRAKENDSVKGSIRAGR